MNNRSSSTMADATSGTYAPFAEDPSFDMDEDEVEYTRGPFLFVVALVVLAAFAGVVYAAYQQGLRQGQSEAFPTVVAQPGPIRVRPENPGGLEEPYQDKFVLNGEASMNIQAVTAEPEEPVDIPLPAEEVAPVVEESVPATEAVTPERTIEDLVEESLIVDSETTASSSGVEEIAEAPVVDTTASIVPEEEVAELVPPVEAVPEEPVMIEAVPEAVAAMEDVAPSAVEEILAPVEEEVAVADPQPVVVPPAPASVDVNAGTYVVQVASVKDNQAQALSKADEIGTRHSSIISGAIATGIQRADLGAKGIYYRVRVGPFNDKADANAVCSSLKGAGQDCLVTKP